MKHTKQSIKESWEHFVSEHGRIPTQHEMGHGVSRYIQRHFGGLKKFREELGYEITNFSSGTTRSKTALIASNRSHGDEDWLIEILFTKFGKRPYVIPWEAYTDNKSKCLSDCGVYHATGHFFVDVFFASNLFSLNGCINHKYGKIKNENVSDEIFYVSTNKLISQDMIDSVLSTKKILLPANIQVLTQENFLKILERYKKIGT